VRLIALAALALLASCGSEAKKKPLGVLPSATTTAQPEWLPRVVHAGRSAPVDPRERNLDEPRRLTTGWEVEAITWAPDNGAIAVAARAAAGAPSRVWIVPLAGGAPHAISADGEVVRRVAGSASPPWRLVYLLDASPSALRETALSQSGQWAAPTNVDVGSYRVDGAALSVDGSAVFFSGAGEGAGAKRGLFALEASGATAGPSAPAGRPRLVSDDKAVGPPALSPDRSYVAWASDAGESRRVMVASIEGRSAREVASGRAVFESLAFVPKSSRLLFASDLDTKSFELYAVDLAAAPAALPVRVTFSQARAPAMSPDGRHVAFASRRGGPTADLYIAGWIDDP
jgi:hypothetical protein